MKSIMNMQSKIYNLKRFLATGLLAIGLPIVVNGQGTLEHITATGLRAAAQKNARNGDYSKAQGQANAANLMDILGNAGDAGYIADKNKEAEIEAAKIRADAERDATRIRAGANEDSTNMEENNIMYANLNDGSRVKCRQIEIKNPTKYRYELRAVDDGRFVGYIVPLENGRQNSRTEDSNISEAPSKETYRAFTCGDVILDTKNKIMNYEEKGKINYNPGQKVNFILGVHNQKDSVIVRKVLKDGQPFDTASDIVKSDNYAVTASTKNLDAGKYSCEWYVNGEITPIRRVEIEVKP